MNRKRLKIIGTNPVAISETETDLGFRFSPSFREWIIENNGAQIAGIHKIYPVFDRFRPVATGISLNSFYREGWLQWVAVIADSGGPSDFGHLLPFGEAANGDCYCFDYSRQRSDGETPIVLWSHDTGETQDRAETFVGFVRKAENGDYKFD
jgi:hypothetical protein